jgi:hypothetical protein
LLGKHPITWTTPTALKLKTFPTQPNSIWLFWIWLKFTFYPMELIFSHFHAIWRSLCLTVKNCYHFI